MRSRRTSSRRAPKVLDWSAEDDIEDDDVEDDDDDKSSHGGFKSTTTRLRSARKTNESDSDEDDEDSDSADEQKLSGKRRKATSPFTMKRFRVESKHAPDEPDPQRRQRPKRSRAVSANSANSAASTATRTKSTAKPFVSVKPRSLTKSAKSSSRAPAVISLLDEDEDEDDAEDVKDESGDDKDEVKNDNMIADASSQSDDDASLPDIISKSKSAVASETRTRSQRPRHTPSPELEVCILDDSDEEEYSDRIATSRERKLGQDDASKGKSERHSSNANDGASESSGPTQESHSWTCSECTLKNPAKALVCHLCQQHRRVDLHNGQWACPTCTLINEPGAEQCTSCGEVREKPSSPPSSGRVGADKITEEASSSSEDEEEDKDEEEESPLLSQKARKGLSRSTRRHADSLPAKEARVLLQSAGSSLTSASAEQKRQRRGRNVRKEFTTPSEKNNVDHVVPSLPGLWSDKHRPESLEVFMKAVAKKKVEEIRQWMQESSRGTFRPLLNPLVLHGPSGAGKSLCVELIAKELAIELRHWKSDVLRPSSFPSGDMRSADVSMRGPPSGLEIPYVSQINDFVSFIQASRFPALQMGPASSDQQHKPQSILLIEELPFLKTPETQATFHRALQASVRAGQPMIIISTSDGDAANPTTLRRVFSDQIMSSALSLNLGRIAPGRLTRVLRSIADAEGVSVPDNAILDMALRANGDLRCAIQMLQFYCIGRPDAQVDHAKGKRRRRGPAPSVAVRALERKLKRTEGRGVSVEKTKRRAHNEDKDDNEEEEEEDANARDTVYSINHAVGKLLRAKTLGEEYDEEKGKAAGRNLGPLCPTERARLAFDPEQVAQACALDADALCAFVQYNAPQHFVEIGELAEALDYLSLADVFIGGGLRNDTGVWAMESAGRAFPGAYVTSLASRSVAATRSSRARLSFAQGKVTRPQVYDVQAQRETNLSEWSASFRAPPVLQLSTSVHSELASFQSLVTRWRQPNQTNGSAQSSDVHVSAKELSDDEIEIEP